MLVLASALAAWFLLLLLGVGICRLASRSDRSDASAWRDWMTASDPLSADRVGPDLGTWKARHHPSGSHFRATG